MDNPLIDLKALAKPVTKLIDVTAKAIGTIYAPFGTIRQAKADAKARIIHAMADQDILTLEQRSKSRLEHLELLRQENIESVVVQAALEMPDAVSDAPVDEDWIMQFFNHAKDVCDQDMQKLWSRILAGEVTCPGSYSKRTLDYLKSMERIEADAFTTFASFAFTDENGWRFVIQNGITRARLAELRFDFVGHFTSTGLLSPVQMALVVSKSEGRIIRYYGRTFKVVRGEAKGALIDITALLMFSQIGQQLAQIAGSPPLEGYADAVFQELGLDVVEVK